MQRNAGPIYRLKKSEADKAEEELNQISKLNDVIIARKQASIDSINLLVQVEISNVEAKAYDGFAARLEGLDRITANSQAISLAHWFIIFLFIAIESAPIFVKLISPKGPYDDRLRVHEHLSDTVRGQQMATQNTTVRKQGQRLDAPEKEWLEGELGRSLR